MSISARLPASRRGRTRGALVLPVAALLLAFAGAAPAHAVVTTSNVTTPSDLTFDFWDETGGPQEITVAGTSNGTTGDEVDIRCYNGNEPGDGLAYNVPVESDGSFEVTNANKAGANSCRVLAVPAGFTGVPVGFTGPRTGWGYYWEHRPAGEMVEFRLDASTLSALTTIYSAGYCGLCSSELYDADLVDHQGNWTGNGAFYPTTSGETGADVQVDGHNAYALSSLQAAVREPGLGIDIDRTFDPLTGMWRLVETNPIVHCSTDGVDVIDVAGEPTDVNCPDLVLAPVRLVRTYSQAHDGRQVHLTDSWESTDGAAHTLRLRYQNNTQSETYRFPGDADYSMHGSGETVALDSVPVGTMYTQTDSLQEPGPNNPQGAITWLTAPTHARFSEFWHFVLQFDRTVPAGGSTEIGLVYSEAFERADVQALAADAEGSVVAPVVAISSPANGAIVASNAVTVTGTATDNEGIDSLTVNGVATPVGAGGAWSRAVTLSPGANTITAIATDDDGNQGQAQISVTYTPPSAASCTVPALIGRTQSAATTALTGAGCSLGQLTTEPSRTVPRGTVLRQGRAAGERLAALHPVDLVVSSGRVGRALLPARRLRLRKQRLSIRVGCLATGDNACEGTLKLGARLGGRMRTLGTSPFRVAPGAERRVSLRVSRANARRIRRARSARAIALIVYRDEDGRLRTARTRMLIRG